MTKLVFFDIDGTLLVEGERKIDQSVIDAINSIRNENTHVFIATGRNTLQAMEYINQIGATSYVTSNGQEVCYRGKVVYQKFMDKEDITHIKEYLVSNNMQWAYETQKRIYLAEGENADEIQRLITGYGMLDVEISEDHLDDGVFQMWTFGLKEQMDLVYPYLNEHYTALRWGDTSIEIMCKDENKGKGIRELKKYLGSDVTTYAFGDGVNDLDMMKEVDISVAMGNAVEELKEISTNITTNVDDAGIINGLKDVGLL